MKWKLQSEDILINYMLTFVETYAHNIHSQNGEDWIIMECINRIIEDGNSMIRVAVEFGGADGFFCSNVASLRDYGFKTHMFDLEEKPPHVKKKKITPENVNEIPECSILSIDIDGNDYNVWKAFERKPPVVIIEINSSIKPTAESPLSDADKGTCYLPMVRLGIEKGYFLLCHTGNLLFIDSKYRKLFPEIKGDGIENYEEYFNQSWL